MEKFFLREADKYRFAHISYILKFIPYGVAVDSFQHYVYENPTATPHERKSKWREIEKEYLPHRNYNQDKFLEKGGFWFRQRHIFESPFYYIDYALAQICAFQLWKKSKEDMEGCLNDYIRICKVGGTKSFLEIVELANLKSPFEEGCLKTVINEIEMWLDSVDDKGM